ncbi:MAG: signal recognition particle-docking protein FtsY [Candidatus Bathyarchaeia archaeon]
MFEKLRSGLSSAVEKISKTELAGKDLEQLLQELKTTLAENDVAYPIAERICDGIRQKAASVQVTRLGDRRQPLMAIIREVLLDVLKDSGEASFFDKIEAKKQAHEPAIVVFVGINGTGKTTTIAKIAHLLRQRGYTVVIACADTYRTGSIEQLEEHARRVGVKTIKHTYGADAAAVAFDSINHARANGINTVLIDTAGRMQTKRNLLEEMKKIVRVASPDFVMLVVDSLTGNDAVEQGRSFSESVRIDGITLTKLDADARGGSAISLAAEIGKPVVFAGTGQAYEDLISFDPKAIVDRIVG